MVNLNKLIKQQSRFAPNVVLQKIERHEFNRAQLSRLKLESVNLDRAKFI